MTHMRHFCFFPTCPGSPGRCSFFWELSTLHTVRCGHTHRFSAVSETTTTKLQQNYNKTPTTKLPQQNPHNETPTTKPPQRNPHNETTTPPHNSTTTTTTSVAILVQVVATLVARLEPMASISSASAQTVLFGRWAPTPCRGGFACPTSDEVAASLGSRFRKWQRSLRWGGTMLCLAATKPRLRVSWWCGSDVWNESWNRSGPCQCPRLGTYR